MAQRRMFSKRIIESGKFLKMPISSQALYFHLGMHADDDGIVEAFKVMRMTGFNEDDLRVLSSKEYIQILNEDLVTYLIDWNEHNYIRADRKTDSIYQNLLIKMIEDVEIKEKKERSDRKKDGTDMGWSKDGIGKGRLGKDRLGKDRVLCEQKFQEWWKIYDHKMNKTKCLKKWMKIDKSLYDIIINHTREYVKFSTKDYSNKNIVGRKYPLTYLNGEAWNDEITKFGKQEDIQTVHEKWEKKNLEV